MERTVESDFGEVEADDPVERGDSFGFESFEHACCDPLVAASAQCRVRHLVHQDRFGAPPRLGAASAPVA